MTGYGMCGVFIPDRVLAGWWRSQWKASDRMGAGRCTTGCGEGEVYKCECGWDHCSVLGGCLPFLSLCSKISAFAYRQRDTKKTLCRGGRSQDLLSTDF